MSDVENPPAQESAAKRTQNPLLLVAGLVVLGLALAFILFGSDLFDAATRPEPIAGSEGVLSSVPQFEAGDTIVAELPDSVGTLKVGDVAPDFLAVDLQGNPVNLSDFRDRPVIVNFWATWCAPCLIEMPELQAAYEAHADDELAILAVNREEDAKTVEQYFYDEMELTFTPLLDEQAFVAGLFGVFNMPSSYFINGDGVIVAIHRGPLTEGQIDSYLEEAMSTVGG
jgi:peroxiredoxin